MKSSFKLLALLALNFIFGAMISMAVGFNPVVGGSALTGAQVIYSFIPNQQGVAYAPVGFDLTDINAALGAYCRKYNKQIMQLIFKGVELEKYTKKISGVSDEYAISSSKVTEILQSYQKAWTPKGEVQFTAVVNKVRQIKIDFTIEDIDDIYRSWLCTLADESKARDKWAFVKYIVTSNIIPKAKEEMDYNSWNGVYAAPTPGTANNSVDTVDGFGKVIADLITATTITPIATGAITASNIVDRVEYFVDNLDTRYKNIKTPIFMSKTNERIYWRDYRTNFGAMANYDGKANLKVDATSKMIIGLDAMEGSDRFLHTTDGNMLTMFDKIDQINNLTTEVEKRAINLYGDFKRGYGFGLAEEVFVNDQA